MIGRRRSVRGLLVAPGTEHPRRQTRHGGLPDFAANPITLVSSKGALFVLFQTGRACRLFSDDRAAFLQPFQGNLAKDFLDLVRCAGRFLGDV